MIDYSDILNKKSLKLNENILLQGNKALQYIFSDAFYNAQGSIFDSLDSDEDKKINDEELFALKEKTRKEEKAILQNLDTIFKELDSDSDGVISNAEFEGIQNSDSQNMDVGILKKIMVMMGMDVEGKKGIEAELEGIEAELNKLNNPTVSAPQDAGSSNSSGSSGSSGSSSSGNRSDNLDTDTSSKKPKTLDEYDAEINQKEQQKNDLETKSNDNIKAEEDNIQKAMEEASSGLSPSQVQEYNRERDRIATDITKQDDIISSTTAIINDNQAKLSAIPATISAYETQISNLKASLSSGTTEEDKEKNQRIEQKIQNLTREKEAKEKEQAQLEKQIETDTKNVDAAKKEKNKLEQEKDGLLDKFLKENETKIPLEIQNKIRDSQTKIQSMRLEKETKQNSISTEIQTLKNEREQLKEKNESNSVIDKNKESSFDSNGNRIGARKMPSTAEEYAKYGLETAKEIERFENCHQKSKEEIIDLIDYAMEQGMKVNIASSLRTYDEQVAIYRGGENKMAAKPGTSMHESGQAFDISIEGGNRKNPNDPKYRKLGEIWANKGYRWGGYWKNQCEPWHFDTKGAF